jgi:ubiquinol-cytochrome c reductase iron-sulfur subunit
MEFVVATELVEPSRRDFLFIATGAVAAVGAASAVWPFVAQMNPDAATIAAGAPVELDLSPIAAGQSVKVKWRGKIIFVNHRTPKEIEEARAVPLNQLPDPATDEARAKKPEWLVVIGVCTHLGCIPLDHQGEYGGWFCPCHGSHYDTAGRIRKGPAPRNLDLPPYSFVSDTKLLIG